MAEGIGDGSGDEGASHAAVEGVWLVMSQDFYQLDVARHGGAHVDRYTKNGANVGRYRMDKTPIKHKGKLPPPIPVSDYAKFDAAVANARRR